MVTKKQIDEIKEKREKAREEVQKYDKAIDALQDICDHKMKFEGHGHNFSLYRCEICGLESHD